MFKISLLLQIKVNLQSRNIQVYRIHIDKWFYPFGMCPMGKKFLSFEKSISLGGWVGGWMDGWVDGWMDGWKSYFKGLLTSV